MTIERTTLVAIPVKMWNREYAAMAEQAKRAVARYKKAPPGDRREAVRYEGLCRALVRMVTDFSRENPDCWRWDLDDDSIRVLDATFEQFRHPWSLNGADVCKALNNECLTGLADIDGTTILFELRHAFDRGPTVIAQPSEGNTYAHAPSEVWKAPDSARGVFAAVVARWRDQLNAATAGSATPLVPSGVNNRVLCEGLREFVAAEGGQHPIHARIVYRDGSEARPFPLRTLSIKERSDSSLPILRVSLMSMRHPEMDATVDAAWLRNRHVSLSRPAAETDEFVYETSRTQLRELCERDCVCMHVYQTGLEPAVIGFYRAVAEHLFEQNGSIEVVPHFHDSRDDSYQKGLPWATK